MNANAKDFLYISLAEQLAEQIRLGGFPKGRLPTEQDLKNKHAVSVVTVRKAIGELEKQGLVERRQGSGTFIKAWKKPKVGSRFKKTGLIDYIPCAGSEYVPGSFYNFLMQAVQQETMQRAYNCVISPAELSRAPEPVIKKRVDGILVAGNFYLHDKSERVPSTWASLSSTVRKDNDAYLHQLACSGLPMVAVANYTEHVDAHVVRADFDAAFNQMITHLQQCGHQHIAYIGGDNCWPEFEARSQAFKTQMLACGMSLSASSLLTYPTHGAYNHEAVVQSLVELLSRIDRPSALIVGAGGVQKVEEAAAALGLSIPEDFSLIAVSDASPTDGWADTWRRYSGITAHSSVCEIPVRAMAEAGVERLLALIDGHEFAADQRCIKVPLIFHPGETIAQRTNENE